MIENTSQSAPDWRALFVLLDQQLLDQQALWRPQPFKQRRPDWCQQYPQLCTDLLQLSEAQLQHFTEDEAAMQHWLVGYIPALQSLFDMVALAPLPRSNPPLPPRHFFTAIPGRKQAQIEAFSATLGAVQHPLLEWCGGKGHLGRLLGAQWRTEVCTLEWDAALCDAGRQLAARAGVAQRFEVADVLAPGLTAEVAGKHAIALHACGVLHRTLGELAGRGRAAALDIVPCCYAVGVDDAYRPFCSFVALQLQRDDLRLAVTETVTAGAREVRLRDTEMAWKLGFNALREAIVADGTYRPLKPIRKAWLQQDFAGFCQSLALREGLSLPDSLDWAHYEAVGWQRQREVMRLLLVRHAFRRAVELWLVLDLVCWLETQGYGVALGTFCERSLTPRNLMISARRPCNA